MQTISMIILCFYWENEHFSSTMTHIKCWIIQSMCFVCKTNTGPPRFSLTWMGNNKLYGMQCISCLHQMPSFINSNYIVWFPHIFPLVGWLWWSVHIFGIENLISYLIISKRLKMLVRSEEKKKHIHPRLMAQPRVFSSHLMLKFHFQ